MIYLKKFENSNNSDVEIHLYNFVTYLNDMYKAVDLLIELSKICKKYECTDIDNFNPKIEHNEIDDEYVNDLKDKQAIMINKNRSVSYGYIKNKPDFDWIFYFHDVDMKKINNEIKIYIYTLRFNI